MSRLLGILRSNQFSHWAAPALVCWLLLKHRASRFAFVQSLICAVAIKVLHISVAFKQASAEALRVWKDAVRGSKMEVVLPGNRGYVKNRQGPVAVYRLVHQEGATEKLAEVNVGDLLFDATKLTTIPAFHATIVRISGLLGGLGIMMKHTRNQWNWFGNGGTTAYQECWIPLRLAYHQGVRLELTPRDTWFDVLCKGGYLSGVKLCSCAGTGDVTEHENPSSELGKALRHLSGTRPFTWLKKRGLLGMHPLLISVAFIKPSKISKAWHVVRFSPSPTNLSPNP